MPPVILFHFTCFSHFCNEICQLQKSLKYFSILRLMKNNVRFGYVPWKNVWFYFFSIVWVHSSHKTEKFWFWKLLKCFNIFFRKNNGVRFDYVVSSSVWFGLSSGFEQNVCNKLRNKNFIFYLNSLMFLNWGIFVRSKFVLFLSLISLLWHYCRNSFEYKTSLLVLKYIGIL